MATGVLGYDCRLFGKSLVMVFIEPLDARRLYARTAYATGRDVTFADDGHLSFAAGFRAGYSLDAYFGSQPFASAVNGATFVSGMNGEQPQVAKFLDDGTIDTSFGVNGYANIPFEATRLAYDDRNALLYVAGRVAGRKYDIFEAKLTRLRVKGRVDKSFAGDGTFDYSLAVGPGENASAAAVIDAINPLADGSVVLGVDRSTLEDGATTTQQSLALIKLRPDGLRDRRYGDKGIVQLLSGTVGAAESGANQDFTRPTKRGVFADVQTNRNGKTSALITFTDGVTSGSYESLYNDDRPTAGTFFIKSRVVSSRGVNDESQAYSWKLGEIGGDGPTRTGLNYVGREGEGVVAIVSTTINVNSAADDGIPTLYRQTFVPGVRGPRVALPDPGVTGPYSVSRSTNGEYVAAGLTQIVRLRKNLTRDTTFADNGFATAAYRSFGNYYVGGPYIDPFGRVLAFEGLGVLERFD